MVGLSPRDGQRELVPCLDLPAQLRRDALDIWQAGVAAVDSERLVAETLRVEENELIVGPQRLPIETLGRILVVGAGKAGWHGGRRRGRARTAADRRETTRRLGQRAGRLRQAVAPDQTARRSPRRINEPTPEGVVGTKEILRQVAVLRPEDLCTGLISGGGSALLPAPQGITLDNKRSLTLHLSAAGADIVELNTVRKQLSRIKGGGLARGRTAPADWWHWSSRTCRGTLWT